MPVPAEVSESGQLILGLLTLLGLIVTAGFGFLSVRATQTRNHVRAAAKDSFVARDQLQNSHPQNFRDDLDDKFNLLGDKVKLLTDMLGALGLDVGGMKSDIRILHRDNAADRETATADRKRLTDHIDRALTEAVATHPKETS